MAARMRWMPDHLWTLSLDLLALVGELLTEQLKISDTLKRPTQLSPANPLEATTSQCQANE